MTVNLGKYLEYVGRYWYVALPALLIGYIVSIIWLFTDKINPF